MLNRKQVWATRADAEKDNVVVPTTLQEYCVSSKPRTDHSAVDIDFYDDDYVEDNDEDDDSDSNMVHDEREGS